MFLKQLDKCPEMSKECSMTSDPVITRHFGTRSFIHEAENTFCEDSKSELNDNRMFLFVTQQLCSC